MSLLDQAILSAFPMLTMPRHIRLERTSVSGTRYIAASDGLWREITLPWIRCIHQVAVADVMLPYGDLQESLDLACGPIPRKLRMQFVKDAVAASPIEVAAAMIWNQNTDQWRYELRESLRSDAESISFKEVDLAEGEFLVLDLHSHGREPAYFSAIDDHDDAGSMKFSGVLGELHTDMPSSEFRLNMVGKSWVARMTANGSMEVVQ